MVATMMAKLVGDIFTKSLYQEALEMKSIPYLEEQAPFETRNLLVTSVMSSPVFTLHELEKLDNVVKVATRIFQNRFSPSFSKIPLRFCEILHTMVFR